MTVFVVVTYLMTNARIIPLIHGPSQGSRMAAWEGGIPSIASYAEAFSKAQGPEALRSEPIISSEIPSFLDRTAGVGWEMWDRSSVLHDQMNLTCNWNDYRPFIKGEVAPAVPFCAHPLSDDQFISNNIVKKGRHLECDGLPKMLDHSLSSMNGQDINDANPVIYMDIGTNIGTCVMQMVLTTNATILAFEPHPYNLFVMTSTFMKMEEQYRNRIHLFPIALGSESAASTIHMASDNRGHAVVSKVIRINKKATFLPPMPIRVEPLDSIVKETATVHLIKMDAQGFECYIVDGMKRVLQRTRTVFFELEQKVLNGFDMCSPQILWDKFIASKFEMHVGGPGRPATTVMPEKGKINIVALNH